MNVKPVVKWMLLLLFGLHAKAEIRVDSTFLPAGSFVSLGGGSQVSNMVLAPEFHFQYIIKTGDALANQSLMRNRFDFTGFVPLYAADSGVLSINHEIAPGGVTMMNVHFNDSLKRWQRDNVSAVDFSPVVATGANCSGTVTPWNTVITCEEAIVTTDFNADGYHDGGWAIEIDPVTRTVVNGQKLWQMGNFRHENAVVHKNRRTVYQGADASVGYLFRFVAHTAEDLHNGDLYVYRGPKNGNGEWVLLKNSTPAECNAVNYQCDTLGATVFNGIEDVEISPVDSMVYLAVKGSNESCVYRFKDVDPLGGMAVENFEVFVGGPGISYDLSTAGGLQNTAWGVGNDNLAFDDQGNLFVLQDGSNNHLWIVGGNHSQSNPEVKIFLRSPAGSEPTGITFSPDFKFMFLSFQHPSSANSTTYLADVTGEKIPFDKDLAIVIARREIWGLPPVCANAISLPKAQVSTCCFYSSGAIESSSLIGNNQLTEFHAGQKIELLPGFSSPAGSTFLAEMDGCVSLN